MILTIVLGLAVGVPLGYALQKGGFCMNSAFRSILFEKDKIDPDEVIMCPAKARQCALTSTLTLPQGNLAPQGSVIKSTAIDPSLVDNDAALDGYTFSVT